MPPWLVCVRIYTRADDDADGILPGHDINYIALSGVLSV
jgi:hypothetical protein